MRYIQRLGPVLLLALACGSVRAQMALAPNEPAPQLEGFLHPKHQPLVIDWTQAPLTLVYFWADWCEPCKQLTPRLESLYATRRSDGLRVIGVYNPATSPDVVTAYVKHHGVTYPILRQSKRSGTVWGTTILPTSYLIDQTGRILRRYAGGDVALMDALVRDAELALTGQPLGPLYAPPADEAAPAPDSAAETPAAAADPS